MKNTKTNLIIGIGNEGRGDDGLAWKFLDELKQHSISGWQLVYRYQLNVEDAELVKNADVVVFVDSFMGKLKKGFSIEECHSRVDFEYTTHALNPCTVLAICNNLYKKRPTTYVLKIQGYEWGLGQGISSRAHGNLQNAIAYFTRKLAEPDPA